MTESRVAVATVLVALMAGGPVSAQPRDVAIPEAEQTVREFGMIEVAFVTRKVGNDWRVAFEPYFLVINR